MEWLENSGNKSDQGKSKSKSLHVEIQENDIDKRGIRASFHCRYAFELQYASGPKNSLLELCVGAEVVHGTSLVDGQSSQCYEMP